MSTSTLTTAEIFRRKFKQHIREEHTISQLKNFAKRDLRNKAKKILKIDNKTITSADVDEVAAILKEAIIEALEEAKEQMKGI